MEQTLDPDIVWIVSFSVNNEAERKSYLIEEKNLREYRQDIADNLRQMLGKGVFDSKEAALNWAEEQITETGCGKAGGCCCKARTKADLASGGGLSQSEG